MRGFVYILQSESGKFYIGSTTDVKKRLRAHELGHTQTTRNMHILKLVLVQEYRTLADARSIEKKLKCLKRKDYLEKIVNDGYIRLKAKRPSFNG